MSSLKSVIYFGNPARLTLKHDQLVIDRAGQQPLTRPLEDIGCIVIDHGEVSLSTPLVVRASEKGVVVVYCDEKHMPVTFSCPHAAHDLPNLRHRQQWEAGAVAYKQAWAQVIRSKLLNQALVLEALGLEPARLRRLAKDVRSGDTGNAEAIGAKYYWGEIFGRISGFYRDRYGPPPNHLLNYGYAILRAATARALAGAGLCLTIGIHHHHRGNPYALADDMMEPYRPWVDLAVARMDPTTYEGELEKVTKAQLISILQQDSTWEGRTSPLMVAMESMAASLASFFAGETTALKLHSLPDA